MANKAAIEVINGLALQSMGVFRATDALAAGVSRKQLITMQSNGTLSTALPGVLRISAVPENPEQHLRAALLWAGSDAVAVAASAANLYRLAGVVALRPTVSVPDRVRKRSTAVTVLRHQNRGALMVRQERGIAVTGVEATLCQLAHDLDGEQLENACEDARRRRLTSVAALQAYLDRFAHRGVRGAKPLRALLKELDPRHPSNSNLEVKTRRLLVAAGRRDFVREFPLAWNGRRYQFDFCFPAQRLILETNGRRWHDDPTDYEFDNEKWSVPGRLGYRIVFATWRKVVEESGELLSELDASLCMPSGAAIGRARA